MGIRSVIVAAILGLYGAPGAAQTINCDPEQPTHCSTPLRTGQPAPYDGQHLTPDLAVTLGQKARGCEERGRLLVERERELRKIETDMLKRALDMQKEAFQQAMSASQAQVDQLEKGPPWYERPPFVAAVAVLGTVGVLTLAVQVVSASQ